MHITTAIELLQVTLSAVAIARTWAAWRRSRHFELWLHTRRFNGSRRAVAALTRGAEQYRLLAQVALCGAGAVAILMPAPPEAMPHRIIVELIVRKLCVLCAVAVLLRHTLWEEAQRDAVTAYAEREADA